MPALQARRLLRQLASEAVVTRLASLHGLLAQARCDTSPASVLPFSSERARKGLRGLPSAVSQHQGWHYRSVGVLCQSCSRSCSAALSWLCQRSSGSVVGLPRRCAPSLEVLYKWVALGKSSPARSAPATAPTCMEAS